MYNLVYNTNGKKFEKISVTLYNIPFKLFNLLYFYTFLYEKYKCR